MDDRQFDVFFKVLVLIYLGVISGSIIWFILDSHFCR